jgi:DNA-binding NtrC family response regulator
MPDRRSTFRNSSKSNQLKYHEIFSSRGFDNCSGCFKAASSKGVDVDGAGTVKTDVRIITATNKDLRAAVEKGEFREDLYYRLKVVPVLLPPLRERKDDIPLLARHFVERFNREMGMDITNISRDALAILLDYGYPRNIMELEHIIEHEFIKSPDRTITAEHLAQEVRDNDTIRKAMATPEPLKALEREMIVRVLDETRWKYSESARKLQISRATLWRKMKKLEIQKRN